MEKINKNNSTVELMPSNMDLVRLVQVTDSHIFADPEGCLLGLNTRQSFESVCQRVNREEWKPDALLATGDLSQDASQESYQYLANAFQSVDIPCFWIAGNHDKPAEMEKYLSNGQVSNSKHLVIGHWQIILLDSSVSNKVYGELSDQQLDFLKTRLVEHSDKHALVVLHHQPVTIGSEWLDEIGLKNISAFLKIVKAHNQVKGVLWGHVHQEYDKIQDDIHWIASPSSCVQFMPGSKDFSADSKAPGYRCLELHKDGSINSTVHRVDNISFTVDYSIKGY